VAAASARKLGSGGGSITKDGGAMQRVTNGGVAMVAVLFVVAVVVYLVWFA
jgi:hypothetical protein